MSDVQLWIVLYREACIERVIRVLSSSSKLVRKWCPQLHAILLVVNKCQHRASYQASTQQKSTMVWSN